MYWSNKSVTLDKLLNIFECCNNIPSFIFHFLSPSRRSVNWTIMGALLSICFKSRGDETQMRSTCQKQKKKKLTKQKSMMQGGGPTLHKKLSDSGRSCSSGYGSTETGPPPTALDRQPSWTKRPPGSPNDPFARPPMPPQEPQMAHQRSKEGALQRTLSFNISGLPDGSPSQRRKNFRKSGRKP